MEGFVHMTEYKKQYSYEEVVEKIENSRRFGKLPGVEVTRRMLAVLQEPQKGLPYIHVAGTNGKGSVCAFLSSVLKETGIPFGTFTSPHLVDIRERFSLNGTMISRQQFSEAFEAVYEAVCQWVEEGNPHPTYFE